MTAEKREGGALSPDARKEIELMIEIDRLFKEIDKIGEEDPENEEARQEIAGRIRMLLTEYQKFFGREAGEAISDYRERLGRALEETREEAA